MKHNFDDYQQLDPATAQYLCTVAGTHSIAELSLVDINDFFRGLHEHQLLEAQRVINTEQTKENCCAPEQRR